MELTLSIAVGVMFGAGVWLILRPRTFQLITGLLLMSYAVNLFIFAMGRLWVAQPPITPTPAVDPALFADVIGFATTALYLVMIIGARGLTGSDHVDGEEPRE